MAQYSYWDGGIIKDEETGMYYMFASRWNQAGGHWGENGISGWQGSQAIYAVSDNLYGPYTDMGPLWPDWCDGAGHNVFPFMVSEDDPLLKGVKLTERQLKEILAAMGVEEIKALGEKFDPNVHAAVAHVDDEAYGENEVILDMLKGYKYKDKVIRHSMVKVAN